jgi:hypothetical protein
LERRETVLSAAIRITRRRMHIRRELNFGGGVRRIRLVLCGRDFAGPVVVRQCQLRLSRLFIDRSGQVDNGRFVPPRRGIVRIGRDDRPDDRERFIATAMRLVGAMQSRITAQRCGSIDAAAVCQASAGHLAQQHARAVVRYRFTVETSAHLFTANQYAVRRAGVNCSFRQLIY